MSTSTEARLLDALTRTDLPGFGDERDQQIWMRAVMVAQEVTVLAALLLGTVMVWAGGRPLLWWSVGVIWTVGLGNLAALRYLARYGLADLPWRDRLALGSFRLRLVLIAWWAIGAVLAMAGGIGELDAATIAGMVTGAMLATAVIVLVGRRVLRTREQALPTDDTFE